MGGEGGSKGREGKVWVARQHEGCKMILGGKEEE